MSTQPTFSKMHVIAVVPSSGTGDAKLIELKRVGVEIIGATAEGLVLLVPVYGSGEQLGEFIAGLGITEARVSDIYFANPVHPRVKSHAGLICDTFHSTVNHPLAGDTVTGHPKRPRGRHMMRLVSSD